MQPCLVITLRLPNLSVESYLAHKGLFSLESLQHNHNTEGQNSCHFLQSFQLCIQYTAENVAEKGSNYDFDNNTYKRYWNEKK